jgi:MFS transporter, FSR family, fosmidomycin resistance protein
MSRKSADSSILFFIGSTHFLVHVLSQLLPAVLPVIRSEMGLSLTQASLLISIPLMVGVFAYLPVGFISKKNGTLLLVLSLVLIATGGLIIPSASSYAVILLGFGILGLGQTMYHPPALKVAGDVEPKKLGLTMGVQMAGGEPWLRRWPHHAGAHPPRVGLESGFLHLGSRYTPGGGLLL